MRTDPRFSRTQCFTVAIISFQVPWRIYLCPIRVGLSLLRFHFYCPGVYDCQQMEVLIVVVIEMANIDGVLIQGQA